LALEDFRFALAPAAPAGFPSFIAAGAGMNGRRSSPSRFLLPAVAMVAALALAACGRAGGLELPPGPAVSTAPAAAATPAAVVGGPVASGQTAQETAQKNGFDAYGNPIAPPGEKKSFLLDPLLR